MTPALLTYGLIDEADLSTHVGRMADRRGEIWGEKGSGKIWVQGEGSGRGSGWHKRVPHLVTPCCDLLGGKQW